MKTRRTLAAAGLFAALAAWIYFYEYRGEPAREAAAQAARRIASFDESDLERLLITREGARIELLRESGQWRLVSPVETAADQDQVAALISTISKLEVIERLGPVGEEPGAYGLDHPAASIRLARTGEAGAIEFDVGARTPIGNSFYAREGASGSLVTISGSASRLVESDPGNLRFRKIVDLDPWEVTGFHLKAGERDLRLRKEGSRWLITDPFEFPADSAKVSTYLHELSELSASGFEESAGESGKEPAADPGLELEVEHAGGTLRLRFDEAGDEPFVRARRGDMPEVFRLSADSFRKARIEADELRDSRIAPVDRWNISGIRAELDGVRSSMVKDPEANWRRDSSDGPSLDRQVVDAMLEAVEGARAVGYEDAPRPAGEKAGGRLSMEVAAGDAEPIRVTLDEIQEDRAVISSSVTSSRYIIEREAAEKLIDAVQGLGRPSPALSAVESSEEESS